MKRPLALVGLGAASGALLFVADFPVHAWPVQTVAFLPLLVGLAGLRPAVWLGALAGFALGVAYNVPLAIVLEFPVLMGGGLALALALQWALFGALAVPALRAPAPLGALGVAAAAVVLETVGYSVVPVWGTAQCFARVWSAAPPAIQIVSLTGMAGLVFVLVGSQALVAAMIVRRQPATHGVTVAVLLGAAALGNFLLWRRPAAAPMRVAAMGWVSDDGRPWPMHRRFSETYEPLLGRAVAAGARLVVSPEVGFWVPGYALETFRDRVSALAARHRVTLAVGYFDEAAAENRILFVDAEGRARGEYRKTHLIPFLERYRAGDGKPVIVDLEGLRLGGMICQDDNFLDIARRHGRTGAGLVAVPTNDWAQVKDYHLENALFRGVENGYAIVRAATNGVSVIASPRGEVRARQDHVREGAGLIVAEVPTGRSRTAYSRFGEWLPALCAALLALAWWRGRDARP